MKKLDNPIYVTRSFLPPLAEYAAELGKIWQSHWLTNNGALHNALEQRLQEYLGVDNVTLFVNGHSALDVAIKALKLTGEAITTPFTFASTAHAIAMNGLTPVFCDIKLSDYTIDEEKIEVLITPRTSAIIAVHVYGYPCAVGKIAAIARRHNLKVIYDAAHAFGVTLDGVPIGRYGDASMMSFHATKVFHTVEGGALLYGDGGYRREFDLYKNFGITGTETVEAVGLNAKMNEFCAAMGLVNLRYVESEIEKRRRITEIYRDRLKDVPGLRLLPDRPNIRHNYAYLPILIDEKEYGLTRDELFERLQEYSVFARKYFYPLVPDYDCYREKYGNAVIPVARYVAERIITLPIYGGLDLELLENICDILTNIKKD